MKSAFIALFAGVVGCASVQLAAVAGAAKWNERVLHSFNVTDGSEPSAGLVDVNGTLYGTTSRGGAHGDRGGGTVFAMDATTGAETVLWSFGRRGPSGPMAGLVDVKGKLNGTTIYGGSGSGGTVFSLDPATGRHKVLYSFSCTQGSCPDGAQPFAGLINVNGTLYGTTAYGGPTDAGTVFSVDPKSGAETVVYAFAGGTDGADPQAGLIDVNGTLYGTTSAGGSSGSYGTVFSIDPTTGTETVLYAFKGRPDGAFPDAGLIDVNGILYGTTVSGGGGGTACDLGAYGCGTAFSLDPATGTETVLYSFCGQTSCTDGAEPLASLIDVNGTLYGTTELGGTTCGYGCGVVFSLDPGTGTERVLHAFTTYSDGAYPQAGLIHVNGKLYGTTFEGGADSGYGTVFVLEKTQ